MTLSPLDMFMFDWFGDTLAMVLLFNLVLVGAASYATGQGVASTWRPWRQLVVYAALLSAGLRFFDYALAEGELWSIGGFLLGWAVQLAAMSNQADANALRDKLRTNGFDGFVDSVQSGGKRLWRVRAGPQTQRSDAQRVHDQIKAKLGIDGNVVSVP